MHSGKKDMRKTAAMQSEPSSENSLVPSDDVTDREVLSTLIGRLLAHEWLRRRRDTISSRSADRAPADAVGQFESPARKRRERNGA